jgi:hypothetical protein
MKFLIEKESEWPYRNAYSNALMFDSSFLSREEMDETSAIVMKQPRMF